MVTWLTWMLAFSSGVGKSTLLPPVGLTWMVLLVPVETFFLVCPNALAASVDCQVLADRWFQPPTSRYRHGLVLVAWSAEVHVVQCFTSPLAPACWIALP